MTGWRQTARHKMQHDKLKQQVMGFVGSDRDANAHLSSDVPSFLERWVIEHIEKSDKAYGGYLNSKGIR